MPCQGPVHLRRAVIDDAAGIAHIYAAGWQEEHAGLVPAAYAACRREKGREELWRHELAVEAADRTPWVALIDERLVGFANGGLSRDAGSGPGTAEVYQLYVAPDCWGGGIGSSLLRHVSKDLRDHGFSAAEVWVVDGNERARRFMEHHGWAADGTARPEECGGVTVQQVRYRHALR
jgi:GNAT superfamily N-acetyltransferase